MKRPAAGRWLVSREFWADREAVDELLESVTFASERHPGLSEADILAGMDIDRSDRFSFDMETLKAVRREGD
jgi:hypothetical protein